MKASNKYLFDQVPLCRDCMNSQYQFLPIRGMKAGPITYVCHENGAPRVTVMEPPPYDIDTCDYQRNYGECGPLGKLFKSVHDLTKPSKRV